MSKRLITDLQNFRKLQNCLNPETDKNKKWFIPNEAANLSVIFQCFFSFLLCGNVSKHLITAMNFQKFSLNKIKVFHVNHHPSPRRNAKDLRECHATVFKGFCTLDSDWLKVRLVCICFYGILYFTRSNLKSRAGVPLKTAARRLWKLFAARCHGGW